MTDELRNYLNYNKHLLEQENYAELERSCPGMVRRELYKLLLDCSENDWTLIHPGIFARSLQEGIDNHVSNVHVCHVTMLQPHRDGDFYVGEFEYLLVANDKIYEGTFEYALTCTDTPRGSNILKKCAHEFVKSELKRIIK